MNRERYDEYLRRFNARDYQGVLEFFTDDLEVSFAGYALKTKQEVLDFYAFLHTYINEQIRITRFVSNEDTIAMEAIVRLEGIKTLSPETLAEKGFERLVGLEPGQVVEIPQFIHYHLKDGKFTHALCAIYQTPEL